MLLLILQIKLAEDELPKVSGPASAATYEDYRACLADAANWALHDVTLAQDQGPTGLQIIASKAESSLDGVTLGLQRVVDDIPHGQIVAVSLQVLSEQPAEAD